MNTPKKPTRGRPQTPLLERLRVMTWSLYVMERCGSTRSDLVEERLNQSGLGLTKGQWSRYVRGDVIPQGAKTAASASLVRRIDAVVPNSAYVFNHPVWLLLDFDYLLGPYELRDIYRGLGDDIWALILPDEQKSSITKSPDQRNEFWLPQFDAPGRFDRFKDIECLDGVAISLIEVRLAYLGQAPREFVAWTMNAIRLLGKIAAEETRIDRAKARTLTLLAGVICILHALVMVRYLPDFPEPLKNLREGVWAESEELIEAYVEHIQKHPPKAQRILHTWINEVIENSGLPFSFLIDGWE